MNIDLYYEEFLKDPGINGSIQNLKNVLRHQQKLCESEIHRLSNSKLEADFIKSRQLNLKRDYYKRLIENIEDQIQKLEKEKDMTDLETLIKLDLNIILKLKEIGILNIYTLLKTKQEKLIGALGKEMGEIVIIELDKFIKNNNIKLSMSLELKDILELDTETSDVLRNHGISDLMSLLLLDEEILIKELGDKAIELIDRTKRILQETIIYKKNIGNILDLSPSIAATLITHGITDAESIVGNYNTLVATLGINDTNDVISKARKYLASQAGEPEIGLKIKDIKLEGLTVKELTALCDKYGVSIPSGAKKAEIMNIVSTQLADKEVSLDRP